MWLIENFTSQKRVFDRSDAEMHSIEATGIFCQGIEIINAVELIECYEENVFQAKICDVCTFQDCKSGDYLTIRRAGEYITFIPAFEIMETKNDWERGIYKPPYYIRSKGCPILTLKDYDNFRKSVPFLPYLENIPSLKMKEAVRILQQECRWGILGSFPDMPALKRLDIIFFDDSSTRELLETFIESLQDKLENISTVQLTRKKVGFDIPTYIIDVKSFPEWMPVAIKDNTMYIHFESGFVCV